MRLQLNESIEIEKLQSVYGTKLTKHLLTCAEIPLDVINKLNLNPIFYTQDILFYFDFVHSTILSS